MQFLILFMFFLMSLQNNFVKAMLNLGKWLLHSGHEVVHIVGTMEKGSSQLGPGSFKFLEPLKVPEDFQILTDAVRNLDHLPVQRLKKEAEQIHRRRLWQWLLQHPDIPEHIIHPSRSMQF